MRQQTIGQSIFGLIATQRSTQIRAGTPKETCVPGSKTSRGLTAETIAPASAALFLAELQPVPATPCNRSQKRLTQARSDWRPVVVSVAVVLALAVAILPSSGTSETALPPSAISDQEIPAAEALRKGRQAYDLKDYAAALRWLRQAADQGVAEAQNGVGRFYANGWGVARDYGEALRWYRKAADQGYVGAQMNIGQLHYLGLGVTQDPTEALRWYRKAADQGNAVAQYNVGLLYAYGKGVAQDYGEAMAWFRRFWCK